jgi:flagellar biogenesis protein FliO
MPQDPIRLILSILGIILILFGAYYGTYYIGRKASGQSRGRSKGKSRSIKLLENFAISRDKSFCVVEIAGKVYVVAVTNQSMTLLDIVEVSEYETSVSRNELSYTQNTPIGGIYSNKLVLRLASFIAGKKGFENESVEINNTAIKEGSFAQNMKSARDSNNISEQQDRKTTQREDCSEGDE